MFWVDWIAYELPPTLQLQFLEEPNTEVLSCGPPPGRTSVTIIHFLQCAPCPHGRGMWFNACSPPTSVILQLFILFASRRRAFQEHHVLLGMLNVSLQLTFSLMQRLGISFLYVYYVKTVYMYIYIYYGITDGLWHAKICLTHPDVSEYLVLYCIKTMFCLCHVLHSTFLKTWYICLNPTLNYKSLRVYSKQKAAGVSSRGKLNIPLSESFITSEQLRWDVCLSFDITCWTLLPQQAALNCKFFSLPLENLNQTQPLRWKCVCFWVLSLCWGSFYCCSFQRGLPNKLGAKNRTCVQ